MTKFTSHLTRSQFLKLAGGAVAAVATPAWAADSLNMRAIPKSKNGERLPIIGLGTAQDFGDRSNEYDAKMQVVKTLVDGMGRVLDTAPSYREAEAVCGEYMEKLGVRDKIFLSTKVQERGKVNGVRSIEQSCKSLGVKVIDVMHIHNMVDVDTHLPTLRDLKAQGRIRYIGVTSTGSNQNELTRWIKDVDFIQFAYSVDMREPEKQLLPKAQEAGVATFIALPFGRNRLLNAVKGKTVPEWATKELGCDSFAQLALKFVVSHPAVTVAIPGTNNPRHMADNLRAGSGKLPDAKQREKIAALWTSLGT